MRQWAEEGGAVVAAAGWLRGQTAAAGRRRTAAADGSGRVAVAAGMQAHNAGRQHVE